MAPKPIRLLALLESYENKGPARNLIAFARRAGQSSGGERLVEVSIVTFHRGEPETDSAFVAAAREAGISTFVISERRRFDLGVLPQLRTVVAESRPDILQSHNVKSHLLVKISGLYRLYPWVSFVHGYTAKNVADRVYSYFDRWSLPAAFRVVSVCQCFAERLKRQGVAAERITVQHNPVDPFTPVSAEEVAKLRMLLGIPEGMAIVLAVGRLSREKGHRDLVQAVGLLRGRSGVPAFRLVLAGDGPERSRLERYCAAEKLKDSVIFAGHQKDVAPYYSAARLVVLPSHSEGSPNVLLEAMAAGVPVVATRAGGIPEIAEHERTALLVEKRNPKAMADAIERVLKDEDLSRRMAEAARVFVTAHHSPEGHRQALVKFYEKVMDSFNASRARPGQASNAPPLECGSELS